MDHVPPDVFGEDCLYFYEEWLDDELSSAQAGSRCERLPVVSEALRRMTVIATR